MRATPLLVILVAAILATSAGADQFGFKDASLVITVGINSTTQVIPTTQHAVLDYAKYYITFFPRDTTQQKVLAMQTTPSTQLPNASTIIFEWDKPTENLLFWEIKSTVQVSNHVPPVRTKVLFPIRTIPDDVRMFTQPSPNIDSDQPEVISLASQLAEGKDDLYEVVFSEADWVRENINYSLSTLTTDISQPSSWVLKNRYGVCDELTTLFIALCRSIGIPARYQSGIAYSNYAGIDGFQPHGWAEVYFPDYGWIPFDVSYGEYGFVDPTHVVFKQSVDSNESASWEVWQGRDVELMTSPLSIAAHVSEERGAAQPLVQLEMGMLKDSVSIGSCTATSVTVTNPHDYYIATDITIGRTDGVTAQSPAHRMILLKPAGKKILYWALCTDPSLSPDYLYTFPITAVSSTNVTAFTQFRSSRDDPSYSLSDIQAMIPDDASVGTAAPVQGLSVTCHPMRSRFYVYENAQITCTVTNMGTTMQRDLVACASTACQRFDLGIARERSLNFSVGSSAAGAQRRTVTVTNSKVHVSTVAQYYAMDVPRIKMSEVSYPHEVTALQQYQIRFRLENASGSQPANLSILVGNDQARLYFVYDASINKEYIVEFMGGDLAEGNNSVKVGLIFNDANGKSYTQVDELVITRTPATALEQILILIHSLLRALNIV